MQESQENQAIAKTSRDSVTLYDKVIALVVKDQATYDFSVELYQSSLALEKAVHEAHDPVCDHWFALHKQATSNRKADLDKVIEAKKLAKSKGDTWFLEQERIRQEEERRLQEEARRKAEEEARIAREAAEAERKRLEAQEEEDRLRLAQQAEQEGASADEVQAILDTPLPIPEVIPEPVSPEPAVLPTLAPTAQKSAAMVGRWNYKGVVANLAQLVQAAAKDAHYLQYLQANQQAIDALARGAKDNFSLPGCKLDKRRV